MKITSILKPQSKKAKAPREQATAPKTGVDVPADSVDLKENEPGLLTKAAKAVARPIVNFAKRTVGDTVTTVAAAGLVSAATLGAVAVAGPVGLLVPVGIGVVGGIAGGKAAAKVFKRPRDGRFEGLSTGAALASYGMAGALGAAAATGLPLVGAACTAAGFVGGVGMSMAVGGIYGFGSSLMTQALEAAGAIKKEG